MFINNLEDLDLFRNKNDLLIMLPFAGGNSYSYIKIIKLLNNINIVCPELPGRGKFSNEKPIEDINQLAKHILDKWIYKAIVYNDYILFGHSMGGLLVYILAHLIKDNNLKMPKHIIISGLIPPSIERKNKITRLPSFLFRRAIFKIGGIPIEVYKDKNMMSYLEPIFKADFKVVESYKYSSIQKLNTPLTFMYGSKENITAEMLDMWKCETTSNISFLKYDGDHFFLLSNEFEIADYINNLFQKI